MAGVLTFTPLDFHAGSDADHPQRTGLQRLLMLYRTFVLQSQCHSCRLTRRLDHAASLTGGSCSGLKCMCGASVAYKHPLLFMHPGCLLATHVAFFNA